MDKIKELIPHREPFLFVKDIIDQTESSIITSTLFSSEMDVFKGHFPGNPIVPGVLLCEAVFQSGALLMGNSGNQTPIVTRIQNTKFKNMLKPNEQAKISVEITESLGHAFHLKGKITKDDTTILTISFSCALIEKES